MQTARGFVVGLLTRLDADNAYSNLLLDDALSRSGLDKQDRKFASALFYGVLERRYTLDKIIEANLRDPRIKLAGSVRNILRTGFYQLLYMDSVPDNAAVDESVKLAKESRNPAASGFVNAMLRSFIRAGKSLPTINKGIDSLALEYSCPPALVRKWLSEYGEKNTLSMLRSSLGQAPSTIRVNTTRTSVGKILEILRDDGFEAEQHPVIKDCVTVSGSFIEGSRAYSQGLFHVQDVSCQLCCMALGARSGETVLDICSAPGGKAFTIAELMNNEGRLLAFDLHKNRVRLIKSGAERLGLTIISAFENNGKVFDPEMPVADRVLCDVPCSGLGVIRRKPEIKYKDLSEFERLPEIQYAILETSALYVRTGGTLVYSTCTLSKAENEGVTERFLKEHPDFEKGLLPELLGNGHDITITPDRFGSDGFYIAVMKKR